MTDWIPVQPSVDAAAEFYEIANDFSRPLELLREAISNAIDASATFIKIGISVEKVAREEKLIIRFCDDGTGMTYETLEKNFWGLGYSTSRDREGTIGEKGHGTKIYLRSEKVHVRTQSDLGAFESVCDFPLQNLQKQKVHTPLLKPIPDYQITTGTEITITGYNQNNTSDFRQDIVKDYLLWFTKTGSIERIFGIEENARFKTYLKCIDRADYEEIALGHYFPDETPNTTQLFDEYYTEAADYFVMRRCWQGLSLPSYPDITVDAVISVEGDAIKHKYNEMLVKRVHQDKRRYSVRERYGLWLCKDYIPFTQKNEWVKSFGTGSNSVVLLHAFVNCQALRLTANRGDIASVDPVMLDELQTEVESLIRLVDHDLKGANYYDLLTLRKENQTLQQEKTDYELRKKALAERKVCTIGSHKFLEPTNESELYGLFIQVYTLHPDIFDFEPLDYNTKRGVDIIARIKDARSVADSEYQYIELKYKLKSPLNHSFKHTHSVLCWDFDSNIDSHTVFKGIGDNDDRKLVVGKNQKYFLQNDNIARRVQVIKLKELLKTRLNIEFVSNGL